MFVELFRERRRSRMVRGLVAHDPLAEQLFDRFVNAAASAFGAPIAAVSLIHDDKQTVKAAHGFPVGCMPRAESFCRHTIDGTGVLECVDPQGDPRFCALPGVVGAPHARYYIGAPLHMLSGIVAGALCVVDTVRRDPASDDQKAYLVGLARQAAVALESRMDLRGHAA